MKDTVFGKIIKREVPARIVYEDDECLAFHDITPQAPVHILIISKKEIPKLSDATWDDQTLLGSLLLVAAQIAKDQEMGNAFRIVINNGAGAGQAIFHLHIHLLAGRPFTWPPG